jgi:hypothetical protein
LRHDATSRKVTGSIPDEVIEFLQFTLFPATLWPGVYSACNKNEYYLMFLESKAQPALKAVNPTATCEPFVLKMWDP